MSFLISKLSNTIKKNYQDLAVNHMLFPAFLIIVSIITLALSLRYHSQSGNFQLLLLAILCVGFVLFLMQLQQFIFQPVRNLSQWASDIREGKCATLIDEPFQGSLSYLVSELNHLGKEIKVLSEDTESHVAKQTERLAQKTASLKILYDAAANINQADNLDELLTTFLRTFNEMCNAKATTVRLLSDDGYMRLIGHVGSDQLDFKEEKCLSLSNCFCGHSISDGDILCLKNPKDCRTNINNGLSNKNSYDIIVVPLQHHSKILGVYHIFVGNQNLSKREDIKEMLITIGRHLGMAIEKEKWVKQSHRLSIIEERTSLAHELHDSLAQTIASMRFQIRLLDEMLHHQQYHEAADEALRIKNTIEEANTELRELLSHFRAPLDKRGLILSIKEVIQKFQNESGIVVYFQQDCHHSGMSVFLEMQLLRIIQECIANIRKHSQASIVRLLLKSTVLGQYTLLIEDDGVGFTEPTKTMKPGECIGLSIMKDRAKRLGGVLNIESEPGEGVRVMLEFQCDKHSENTKIRFNFNDTPHLIEDSF